AIKALTDTEQKKSKKQLFGNQATGVYLHIRYKLPAYPKLKQPSRHYFELPFPEKAAENSSICLILPDLYHAKADKSEPDVDKQSREWFEIFREKFGLTSRDISKIYTLNQLKREVHTQQDKRKLMETYDIILIDRTIMPITLFHLEKWSQRGFK
uniref:Uncharacterized protein n=1 Tax=Panagrolaimus sp. JU765 TaxID=591449 RepID=A0AC34Q026_9BILA